MKQEKENETLAMAILDFLKTEIGLETDIETSRQNPAEFQIETDLGNSFTFEIYAPTKVAVAWKYFDHVRHVWRYMLNEKSSLWYRLTATAESKERLEMLKNALAKMDAWEIMHRRE